MYEIKVEKECGCLRKENKDFPCFKELEDARRFAREIAEDYNKRFCNKHVFGIELKDKEVHIVFGPNI
jgi:hypothetical protein